MSESLARLCRDPFTAQLLVLIAEQPGINTRQLAARLNQTQGRTGKYLARLRQAGLLTALIPKMNNQPYRWMLAGYQAPLVEPEPVITPEPVIEEDDDGDDDDEAGFSVAAHPSAKLPKGLTPEDLEWHRYWQSHALQR
ncbi:MAG: MarR family transcriptional regulator, partial [Candidatus Contendobacter sp.]|nr:MarR family transcriptional regulator [Candidatus Contendobacter sp.]